MPNLGLHVGFALDCGRRLGHPVVDDHQGSFLLGCTTPDIRLFMGWERERTHFFKLATDPCGAGFEGLMRTNPHLRRSESLSRETVAFILGYVSHLYTDETWIVQVWRRYFGRDSALAGDPAVQLLDRAFQFELDRQERQRIQGLEEALESIKGAYAGVEVGFIDGPTLRRWQETVLDRVGRDLPWERFRGFVRRVHRVQDDAEIDAILGKVPQMLEKVRAHVQESEVQAFRENAIRAFVVRATEYLAEGEVE